MRPRRQRAQRAVLRCWRRVIVFANLWGKAKVLKFFAPSHFGAFTQSSLVLKFFAARRRELRLQREARDRSQPSTDRDDERHARRSEGQEVVLLSGDSRWARSTGHS